MFHYINKLVSPPVCSLCDEIGTNNLDLCQPCHDGLPVNRRPCTICALPLEIASPLATNLTTSTLLCGKCLLETSPIDQTVAPYVYAAPVDHMIKQLKFHGGLKFARLAGQLMAQQYEGQFSRPPTALLPVPQHPARLTHRGFNHAEQIASVLAGATNLPLLANQAFRTQDMPRQASLNALEREKNMRRAFFAANQLREKHITLVDDVVTTGATTRALAQVLKRAGAKSVTVWAFARTP